MGSSNAWEVDRINDIPEAAARLIAYYDNEFPEGKGMNYDQLYAYSQAHGSKSYLGVQPRGGSRYAVEGMIKSLTGHWNPRPFDRSELYEVGLKPVREHILSNPDVMDYDQADVITRAAMSSPAMYRNVDGKYRDLLMQVPFDEILDEFLSVDFTGINISDRHDRRGKQRAVISFNGITRAVDTWLNAGLYRLFDHERGFLKDYSIEGMNRTKMFQVM